MTSDKKPESKGFFTQNTTESVYVQCPVPVVVKRVTPPSPKGKVISNVSITKSPDSLFSAHKDSPKKPVTQIPTNRTVNTGPLSVRVSTDRQPIPPSCIPFDPSKILDKNQSKPSTLQPTLLKKAISDDDTVKEEKYFSHRGPPVNTYKNLTEMPRKSDYVPVEFSKTLPNQNPVPKNTVRTIQVDNNNVVRRGNDQIINRTPVAASPLLRQHQPKYASNTMVINPGTMVKHNSHPMPSQNINRTPLNTQFSIDSKSPTNIVSRPPSHIDNRPPTFIVNRPPSYIHGAKEAQTVVRNVQDNNQVTRKNLTNGLLNQRPSN